MGRLCACGSIISHGLTENEDGNEYIRFESRRWLGSQELRLDDDAICKGGECPFSSISIK